MRRPSRKGSFTRGELANGGRWKQAAIRDHPPLRDLVGDVRRLALALTTFRGLSINSDATIRHNAFTQITASDKLHYKAA